MPGTRLHSHLTDQVAKQIADTREITRRAEELLQQPKPDTFAGRKTQEPFRWQEE